MNEEVQCKRCAHNLANKSCGGCVSQAMTTMRNIVNNGSEDKQKAEISIESFKYSCRVALEDPNELKNINPQHCKFFFPLALKLY